ILREGIESSRAPLDAATSALQECWLEIAERVTAQSVTVTTIGHIGSLSNPLPGLTRRSEQQLSKGESGE
ncbi:MAG: hypothetical protein WCP07_02685, partial [bacterium]